MALLHVLELGDHVLLRLTRFLLAEEVCRQLVPIALKLQNIVLLILSFALKPAELTLNSSQVALRAVTLREIPDFSGKSVQSTGKSIFFFEPSSNGLIRAEAVSKISILKFL